jgi:isopropylmalate/homocitrate/citramalate synthase
MGYEIPPMTPFAGRSFNSTRAGIHADGLMKDEEIYTIFDTKKLLNRPATVEISKTSGLAGLAYWVNQNFRITGTELEVQKNDPLILQLKQWVDSQYDEGRQTMISHKELLEQIHIFAPGRFA